MNTDQPRLKYEELTEKIIGVFYDVYNEVGYRFLESVYEKCLVVALRDAGLACGTAGYDPILLPRAPTSRFFSRSLD